MIEIVGQEYDSFVFSGGEIHIRIKDVANLSDALYKKDLVTIKAHLDSSEEVMKLLMLKESIDSYGSNKKVLLFMPYIPYARQDRRCNPGEAFSLQVFCKLINSAKFDSIYVDDPHSDVAPALLNNVHVRSQFDLLKERAITDYLMQHTIAISPDAGSNKKVQKIAEYAKTDFIRADKIRDLSTGNIVDTIVYCDDLTDKAVTIYDDICDGGRTFIELAKKLKAKNASKINLVVTHGIFSKGLDCLFDAGITKILTLNSFNKDIPANVLLTKEGDR